MNGFNTLDHQKIGQEKIRGCHSLSSITPHSDTPAIVYRAVMASSPTMAM